MTQPSTYNSMKISINREPILEEAMRPNNLKAPIKEQEPFPTNQMEIFKKKCHLSNNANVTPSINNGINDLTEEEKKDTIAKTNNQTSHIDRKLVTVKKDNNLISEKTSDPNNKYLKDLESEIGKLTLKSKQDSELIHELGQFIKIPLIQKVIVLIKKDLKYDEALKLIELGFRIKLSDCDFNATLYEYKSYALNRLGKYERAEIAAKNGLNYCSPANLTPTIDNTRLKSLLNECLKHAQNCLAKGRGRGLPALTDQDLIEIQQDQEQNLEHLT